jgi:hypothetical protein
MNKLRMEQEKQRQDIIQVGMERHNIGGRDKKVSIFLLSDATQNQFTLSSI